ncbi:MAG: Sec-independent protein translocase protein TatB [Gammaproteobacteria bacterium]
MFDVGFWEILLILVLALVVIGPERLPGAARKAGFFVGKARRYIEGVRSEVESELDVNEFKRMLHNQEVQINELQQQLKAGVEEIKSDLPDDITVTDVLTDSPTHSFHDEQDDEAEAEASSKTQTSSTANKE